MGLFERLERGLERAVNGAFAKAFKSSVQPVEIASAMRRAMDDRAAATSRISGRAGSTATVPNMFTVELSPSDYDDLAPQADDLTDELLAACEEHLESQRYKVAGPFRVVFAENTDLETGVFTLRPASARRPFDMTPAGIADESTHQAHGYEEYEELSIGMPVARSDQGTDRPVDQPVEPVGPPAARTTAPRQETQRAPHEIVHAHHGVENPQAAQPVPPRVAQAPAAVTPAPAAPVPTPAPKRPNPVRRPWLDIDGDRYPLLGALTVIGRDHTSDIVLDDPGISRRHAEIRVTTDGPHPVITLTDLGSTNGVFVNGERIERAHVVDGDRLTLGRSSMTLRTGRSHR